MTNATISSAQAVATPSRPSCAPDWRTAASAPLVDWAAVRAVKRQASALAFERFLREEWQKRTPRAAQLAAFMKNNRAWLDDYALFSVIHESSRTSWLDWPR